MQDYSTLGKIRLEVFFPHEIVSAFYHFKVGDLFYGMLTGTPAASKLQVRFSFLFSLRERFGGVVS